MGEIGSVAWMFKRKGIFSVGTTHTEEKVMESVLDAGAEDVSSDADGVTVTCDVTDFGAVRDALENAKIDIVRSGLEIVAETRIALEGEAAQTFLGLLHRLEDNDDAQRVFHNCDISDKDLDLFVSSQS